MKRRDFIINSMIVIGGTAFLSGCSKKNAAISPDDTTQIARRKFKNLSIPLLGFGCMRLPMKGGQVDMRELEKMVAYSFEHGVNYFDTAYFYMDGKSENIMGEVLKKYDRSSYFLASKNPIRLLKARLLRASSPARTARCG